MWVCCCWCLEKCHKLSQFDFFGCSWNFLIQSLGDFFVQITNYISNTHWRKLDCRQYIISPLNLTPALCGSAWGSQLSPHPLTTRGLHQTVFGPPLPALIHHPPSSRSSLSPQRAFQDQRSSKAHHKEVSQRGSSVVAAVCRPTVRVTGATTGVFGTSPLSVTCSPPAALLSHTDHRQLFALWCLRFVGNLWWYQQAEVTCYEILFYCHRLSWELCEGWPCSRYHWLGVSRKAFRMPYKQCSWHSWQLLYFSVDKNLKNPRKKPCISRWSGGHKLGPMWPNFALILHLSFGRYISVLVY